MGMDPYVRDTMMLANRGEGRARNLEMVGWALTVIAFLAFVASASIVIGGGDTITDAQRTIAVLSGAGSTIGCLTLAAIFLGFGTLVRNSSRALELAALDSSFVR